MKYLVIVNPISGHGYAEKAIPQIEAEMRRQGLDFDLVRTERPWHAAELAEQAARDGYDVVVIASGDGTANEAINGLMRAQKAGFAQTALALLPVGTGNDMSYGLGVRGQLVQNIETLAKNYRRKIDLGFVQGGDYPQGRYFANGVGIGFDAVVGFVAVKIRWARGLLAYLIAVLQTVFIYYKAPTVELTYNNASYTQATLMISIMNGQRMGGGFFMAPLGDPTDGHFDHPLFPQGNAGQPARNHHRPHRQNQRKSPARDAARALRRRDVVRKRLGTTYGNRPGRPGRGNDRDSLAGDVRFAPRLSLLPLVGLPPFPRLICSPFWRSHAQSLYPLPGPHRP